MSDRRRDGNKQENPLLFYGVALVSVGLALGIMLLLKHWLQPTTTPLFFVAVMVSAWYGGWRAGLLATALSTLAINYFFIEPLYSFHWIGAGTVVQVGVFLLVAGLISALNQSRRSALQNTRRSLEALKETMDREQVLRREAETAKQQAESIMSSINDGLAVIDRDWGFTYVNDQYCEMVKIPRSRFLGESIWDIFPDVVGTEFYHQLHQSMTEQTPTQFEYFYHTSNQWYENRVYPSPDKLTLFTVEITDRKRQSFLLLEQKRLLELTASGYSLDECLSAVCTAISRLSPGSRACFLLTDAVRMVFDRSITPEFAPSLGQGLKDAPINQLAIGTCGTAVYCSESVTCTDIAKDDRWSQEWRDLCLVHDILACHSAPVFDSYNSPLGSLMLCFSEARSPTDWERQLAEFGTQIVSIVFERDRSSLTLRQSEAKYRTLFESMSEGFALIEMIFDENGAAVDFRYLEVNPAFALLTGIEAATGKRIKELVPNLDPLWLENYGRVALTGEPIRIENQIVELNRWFEVYAFCVGDETSHKVACLFFNTTDRKQAEAALQESEERFRALADNIAQFAWMTDENGWIFWYNQRWFDYTGTTLEEMQGWGWQTVHHPEHVDRVVEHFRHCLETGEIWEDTFPLRGKDGEYRWFLSRALPIRDEQGRILCWFGTNTDISDRKQIEETLRQRETELRLVTNAVPALISFIDSDQRYRFNSQEYEEWFGHPATEIYGKHMQEVLGEAAYAEIRPHVEQVLAGQQVTFERQVPYKEGGTRHVSATYVPRLNCQGVVEGFVALVHDISDRHQADKRLHLLYETTRDLLATQHPLELLNNLFSKLSTQLELQYYYNYMIEEKDNRLMLHLRNYGGISEEAAQSISWLELGQHLCGLVAQEHRQIVFNQEQISTHPSAQLICSIGITAYAGQPLIVQGRLLGTLSFASSTRTCFTSEEIDLLQSTCEQMAIALDRAALIDSMQQQAEQLQQANRIKDEFLAVLSHELRSPLNPILGWSKLLRSGKLDETKTAHALATIERNARLQSDLIEDLLDISRILQGKFKLNISPVHLTTTVQSAIETVRLAAEAKEIELIFETNPNLQMLGDSTRLQQVLWNLLSNAVKFTPQSGRVEVRLEQVEIANVKCRSRSASAGDMSNKDPSHFAQIKISDTGKGIHPDFLPHVFDYFRQADSTTTRQFGGLGLGLAIARQIVELHGGSVWAESQGEGLGATFTVRLPLIPRENGSQPLGMPSAAPYTPHLPLAGLQILVVDDEADSREFVVFVLEQAGATIHIATSAGEALTALADCNPAVLVSDVGMPDMDGYMLIRKIRELPQAQGGQVPAIALTAYAGDGNQQRALEAGFQQHVTKPVEPETLVGAIASLIR
ncbi:PAS domain-containing protein [Leptolyngbyaceae cyanobacterium UHCC 1019]